MADKRPLGYAVVGLGKISQGAVLPAFRHSKKAKLVAVVSGNRRKAGRLAAEFGAKASYTYDEYTQCLQNPEVQAVFIATPNGTHQEYAVRAAEAGRHVLCEKPLAATVKQCQAITRACRKNNVRLMTAYRKYFEPASLALKKLLADGKLGKVKIIHTAFTIFIPPDRKGGLWHFDLKAAGGGSLVDLGVYCTNTVRWLTGLEPLEANAYAWSTDSGRYQQVEESICFQLKFPEDLVMQGSSSFGAAQANFLKVFGENGWAMLDPAFAYNEERRLFGKINGRWFEKRFKVIDEFALELDAFADDVRLRREPGPNGEDGLRDVAIMDAIYRAARKGRWIKIHFPSEHA